MLVKQVEVPDPTLGEEGQATAAAVARDPAMVAEALQLLNAVDLSYLYVYPNLRSGHPTVGCLAFPVSSSSASEQWRNSPSLATPPPACVRPGVTHRVKPYLACTMWSIELGDPSDVSPLRSSCLWLTGDHPTPCKDFQCEREP
jgi:hypothetical protein